LIAGIIGAAGYAGAELIRLLSAHSKITGLVLASVSKPGEDITVQYPNFLGSGRNSPLAKPGNAGTTLVTPEECITRSELVFGALPAGTGENYAKACFEKGISYIDLSADFRFDADEECYRAWYGKPWLYPELRKHSVYGLPELNREKIKTLAAAGTVIIGNPGCYPTAVSLACYPALSDTKIDRSGNTCIKTGSGNTGIKIGSGPIIADAISGVTGAGREPTRTNHFSECSDSVSAYKVGAHRHTPEINRIIGTMAGKPVSVIFTPHLGPLNRGILATLYIPLDKQHNVSLKPQSAEITEKEKVIRNAYKSFYADEPFVRILPAGITAATNRVRQSNHCDISVHLDHTGSTLIVISAIDNMVKGAAGQAIQNMNIICGFAETEGLTALPALF